MDLDMKGDWNKRAQENARHYIATTVSSDEETFDRSGQHDVSLFFDGLEHLVTPERRVLDIGCGIGRMDKHVAPRVQHLTGIDVSGEMVRMARERLAHLPNVEFVEGDGWTLKPLADGGLDLVFSHIVFQHMPRMVAASYFGEVYRVLKSGGDFVFQMPEAVAGAPMDPPEEDTFEMRFYSESDLRASLAALGFVWKECRRFAVESEHLNFNQLRIHAHKP